MKSFTRSILLVASLALCSSAFAGQNSVPGLNGYEYTSGSNYRPPVRNNYNQRGNQWIVPALIGGLITYTIINGQRVPVQQAQPEVIYVPQPQPEVIYVPVPQPQPRVEYVERQVFFDECRCWRWVRFPAQ